MLTKIYVYLIRYHKSLDVIARLRMNTLNKTKFFLNIFKTLLMI